MHPSFRCRFLTRCKLTSPCLVDVLIEIPENELKQRKRDVLQQRQLSLKHTLNQDGRLSAFAFRSCCDPPLDCCAAPSCRRSGSP